MQTLHLGDRLVRHIAAQLTHVHRKALGVAWVFCQPVEMLYMHAATPRTVDAPAFELQVDAPAGDRQIAHSQNLSVITPPAAMATVGTGSGFFRLVSRITRAYRSPKTPSNLDEAEKPGSAKSDRIVWGFFMLLA